MKKELIIYSLAIGINRGAVLIYMPLLVHILSLSDYGEFSYVQILYQLAFPLISLNIAAGIAREGADEVSKGLFVYKKWVPYVSVLIIFLLIISCFIGKLINYNLLIYIILLGGIEALHNMKLSVLRAYEKHYSYAIFTISKTLGFLLIIYGLTFFSKISLNSILLYQATWNLLVFLIFSNFTLNASNVGVQKVDLKPVVIFSIFLIPHIISQWAIGAVNRIVVKELLGPESMGVYSISYTLSMVLLILQSGLATILPQNFIRNPKLWLSSSFKAKFLNTYTVACLFVYFFMLGCFYINKSHFKLIDYGHFPVAFYFSILISAFYILGYYYYYSNILFLHKKSQLISAATLITALISAISCYVLTSLYNLTGTAISMLISYSFYYVIVFILSKKQDKNVSLILLSDVIVPIISIIVIIVSSYYFCNFVLFEIVT